MQLTRAKTITTATAKLRRWLTADGALSLTESHSLYGLGTNYRLAGIGERPRHFAASRPRPSPPPGEGSDDS
jgi:hypothetical protein